ncbi:MAG: DUF1365 domain-containing protein [Campylobacterales bacterium]|jgi:DUF1365 family protein
MSHRFLEGTVTHRRHSPKAHAFTYRYFMVDIDVGALESLERNALFSYNGFNLFSFDSKDHFGSHASFRENVLELLKTFALEPTPQMRFVTLPRIAGFVFNPISLLLLCDRTMQVRHLLAEVHNYNGGRTVYHVAFEAGTPRLRGRVHKDMYVSPFFEREGDYAFTLACDAEQLALTIRLDEHGTHRLDATLRLRTVPFRTAATLGLFFRHSLLGVWIVTRTLWQSFKLWRKGLCWHRPQSADQLRRY